MVLGPKSSETNTHLKPYKMLKKKKKKKLPISSLNKEKKFKLTKYNHLTKIWPENNVTTVQFVIHILMFTCQHMDLSLKIIPRKSEASEIISFNNIFRSV